jgi:hypothetical protein
MRHESPAQHSPPPAVQTCETPEQVAGGVQTPPTQVSPPSPSKG